MNPPLTSRMARLFLTVVSALFVYVTTPTQAQTTQPGTIQGRVLNSRNGEYLENARVTIEGTADSRGTAEYNLALGERRASSVRDYLVSLGIAADRLLAVSRGEESPVCTEENEACWQRNRRGHFVFTAK